MTTAVGKNKPAKTPAKYLHIHAFQKQKVITRNKNDTKKLKKNNKNASTVSANAFPELPPSDAPSSEPCTG